MKSLKSLSKHPLCNAETLEAIQEARDIASGKIQTKVYSSAEELFDELDRERKDSDDEA